MRSCTTKKRNQTWFNSPRGHEQTGRIGSHPKAGVPPGLPSRFTGGLPEEANYKVKHSSMWDEANAASWPRDPLGFVFFGRAVDQIGSALFGDQWHIADMAPGTPPSSLAALLKPAEYQGTAKDWLAEHEWRRSEATKHRARVIDTIAVQAHAEKLDVYLRRDGHMIPTKKEWWNTDKLAARFQACKINPKEPFSYAFAGDGFCEMFVGERSLEALVQTLPHSEMIVTSFDLGSLSPYLRFAIGFALRHEITGENNQGTRDWLESQIREDWAAGHGTKLTGKTVDALCQVIRFPNPEATQHGLKASRQNKRVEPTK